MLELDPLPPDAYASDAYGTPWAPVGESSRSTQAAATSGISSITFVDEPTQPTRKTTDDSGAE